MGSNAGWALDDERPPHWVSMSRFFMARFPVTVAQFAAFVGHAQYQPADPRWQHRPDNHPVTYVSWQDAASYCRWLTHRLRASAQAAPAVRALLGERPAARWAVALPTEAQWERAAKGTDESRFPWGDGYEPDRCNCSSAGLRGTTSVGCFPSGRRTCDAIVDGASIEDLCGNVWEWTRSEERPFPYEASDGREDVHRAGHRSLRGGAFNHKLLHAGYRASGTQTFRNGAVGFRVALDQIAVDE
jgi:formylglycine-generating enzyme required for sulfatase activity